MKRIAAISLLLCIALVGHAQENVWVFFSDKGEDATCMLENPQTFLSKETLARKAQQGIQVTQTDLPVNPAYLNALKAFTQQVRTTSRWLNAAVVDRNSSDWDEIMALPFVVGVRPAGTLVRAQAGTQEMVEASPVVAQPQTVLNYGNASFQNMMLNVPPLHDRGVTGRGVTVAVFDAGFTGADTIDVFDSLRIENRILAAYDFVKGAEDVYGYDSHGTKVLSTIGANLSGKMIGTAPHASFILARTENSSSETRQEEYNWVNALEWADSIGVDIVHSSLGYSTFDSDAESYAYEDLDGKTAIITRAADMAAARGIIVTTSAGNEGYNSWKYIVAPCDADSVLCIGSIDKYQKISRFSSIGPTADGRVKPDVVAMGSRTTVAYPNNRIYSGNGTSFSAPLVAGMVACLRQSHPERSNMDIIQAVRLSGDQYVFPDNKFGFGIPNAQMADSLLTSVDDLSTVQIAMAEKPRRGAPALVAKPRPKPKPKMDEATLTPQGRPERLANNFTANPQTRIIKTAKKLTFSTKNAGARINRFQIVKGKQQLTFNPREMKQGKNKIVVKTQALMKDTDYYIHIITDQFEEKIPFEVN